MGWGSVCVRMRWTCLLTVMIKRLVCLKAVDVFLKFSDVGNRQRTNYQKATIILKKKKKKEQKLYDLLFFAYSSAPD